MKGFEIKAAGAGEAEVLLYERIGAGFFEDGITAKTFALELKALGRLGTINVRINSPGGSVFEGFGIYNTLKSHHARKVMHVSTALSIASVIAMAGDEIRMASNGLMMIHDPAGAEAGSAEDLRKTADLLDKVKVNIAKTYAERTGKDQAEVERMMAEETWLDADEAVAAGFADKITGEVALSADFPLQDFEKMPAKFRDRLQNAAVAHTHGLPAVATVSQETQNMSTPTTPAAPAAAAPVVAAVVQEPQIASYQDLVAALTGASSDFLCKQLAAKATLPQAQQAFMAHQQELLAAAKKEIEDAKTAAATVAAKKPGVAPVTSKPGEGVTAAGGGDAIDRWEAAVAEKMTAGKKKPAAIAALVREHPDLHAEYIAAYNAQHRGKRRD